MTSEPPPIDGVRRSHVEARGVKFHVTEAGPADGRPVLAFFPLLLPGFLFLLRSKPGIVPRALTGHSYCIPPVAARLVFSPVSSSLTTVSLYSETLILISF